MTALTEGRHAAQFILSEADGLFSRENGTLLSGQTCVAGQVLMDNGSGKLTPLTAQGTLSGELDGVVKGIAMNNYDATGGDLPIAYLARAAEVNGNLLTYLSESTGGTELAAAKAALVALDIIIR